MKYGNFQLKTRKGLVQLPILLGLLVMAIAIPVATKLVQENQDSRRGAASCSNGSCQLEGMSKCTNNQQYFCDGSCWVWVKKCSNGCGATTCRSAAPPTATRTPTRIPTSTPIATGCHSGVIGKCGGQGNCSTGYRCVSNGAGGFHCSYDPACGGFVPTNTPKPNECSGNATRCNGIQLQRCQNGNWVMVENCAYGCSNGACKAAPTATRTPTATPILATPTPSCLQEGERYQEGKCCAGLIKATTPYGYVCGKRGSCQKNQTKCSDDKQFVLICDDYGYFQRSQACDGGCENGKCRVICTIGQVRCLNNMTLETCSDNGGAWIRQSCSYRCENNKCLAAPVPTSIPTPVSCVSGKQTCTGSSGMMRCNSQGNGYDYFTCGIACVWGRCIGEQVLMNELTPVTNCIKGEYKCVASDGKFTEYQCNQSGYWDVVQECGYGCFAGRCKSNPDSTTNCLKEGERYQDGKCCPGLVRATTPYGYFCGKPGGCTPGSTKCENNSFWKCNESGYYEKLKSCSFGCENGDCKFGCLPRSARCRDEKTLQVCADKGNAWVNRSCNYCHEGICYESRDRAQEVIDTGGITWDGENLPYCEGFGFLDGIGWNTCPDGFICGAQPVEDRNNLYYCERKTTTNTSVRVCSPYTSFCGEGGVLLTCSGDGNRWAGMQQCPQPRPEKGAQYNYSCRQVTPDRGECRPSTPEENRDVAIEMVAANALAVGSALALPAVIANLPAAMVIAQGANAAYSIGNAVYNCEYYSQLTPEQRETCLESGAYAAVNTASAIFGGLNYAGISNAFTVYGQTAVSGGSLALGVNNAVDVCQHSANPTECYLAIGSAVVDTVGFAGDVYSAGSFYQQQQRNYIQALAGNRTAFDALPSYLQQSVISQAYDEAYAYNVALNNYWNRAAFGDRIAFENLNAVDQQAVMPLIHREALYQNWIYNSNLPTLNVEVVAPRANPADWNMNIDSNDPGLIRAVTEVRDYLGGNSVTMDNLNMAVIDRNQAIVGYNRPGNPNHPWTNNNNQFNGPTNIGRYLNPDCPGNVCYQNAALLHIAAANNNIESQLALVYFDLPSGERSGHAVVLFGNDIYDPTWEKKWPFLEWVRNVLPQEGFTNLRFDSEVLVIPK